MPWSWCIVGQYERMTPPLSSSSVALFVNISTTTTGKCTLVPYFVLAAPQSRERERKRICLFLYTIRLFSLIFFNSTKEPVIDGGGTFDGRRAGRDENDPGATHGSFLDGDLKISDRTRTYCVLTMSAGFVYHGVLLNVPHIIYGRNRNQRLFC